MASDQPTIADKLLIAACSLEEDGRSHFTAEDLVIAAWRRFPDAFGLRGHTDVEGKPLYPDSNRVFAEIMGSKPLRKRGFLVKAGAKMYQLTEAGRQQAARFLERAGNDAVRQAGLERPVEQDLKRFLSSRAIEKFRSGKPEDLTFNDACAFWGISPRSTAMELNGRLGHLRGVIQKADRALKEGAATFSHGGSGYTEQDLQGLDALNSDLLSRFADEISTIRDRTDERM